MLLPVVVLATRAASAFDRTFSVWRMYIRTRAVGFVLDALFGDENKSHGTK